MEQRLTATKKDVTLRVHHTLQLIMLTFALCSMLAFLSTSKLTTSCLPWKQASVKAVFRLVSIYSNNFQYQKMNDYHMLLPNAAEFM